MKASSKVLGIFILICSLVSIQCGVTKTAPIAEEEDTIDYYVAGRNLSNLMGSSQVLMLRTRYIFWFFIMMHHASKF